MLGAIIGDVVGSRFEWHNIKTKRFPLFDRKCEPTDDSIMSLAVAKAILECNGNYDELSYKTVKYMQEYGQKYPYSGYGGHFREWLYESDPQPYNSWGNGSAMRVSAAGFAAESFDEAIELSRKVTEVTHNHPEGIKGAEATAVAIYMAKTGKTIDEIKEYILEKYYNIDFTLDDIRDEYKFDVSCQGSVPQALEAFFESKDFEDAIRNAISIGGDSDTIAAITGGIAEAYYGVPNQIRCLAIAYLPLELSEIVYAFEDKFDFKTEEAHGRLYHLIRTKRPIEITNENIDEYEDIYKNVQFFMFAEGGAMGEPGEVTFITREHGEVIFYHANTAFDGFEWKNVHKIFPAMKVFEKGWSVDFDSNNKYFYYADLGMGNHLFVRKRLQEKYDNAFKNATRMGQMYQSWYEVATVLLEQESRANRYD